MLAPCTVALDDPVWARFDRRMELIEPCSHECPAVALVAPMPTVVSTRKLSPAAWLDAHATDVSELHRVASQPVRPSLDDGECATRPRLDP